MSVTYTKLSSFTRSANGQSAHALSSWTEVSASLAATYQGIRIVTFQTSTNGGRVAMSLSTGTAGNEAASTFVDDFLIWQGATTINHTVDIPISVTSGSRLAFAYRVHSANVATLAFHVYGITATAGELPSGITAIRPFNYDTTTTLATAVLPGDSGSLIKGTPVQMTASLSADVAGFGVCPITNNITHTGTYLIDIGTGASMSEVWGIPNIPARRVSGSDATFRTSFWPFPVASGTRVAARQQADTTTVTVRDISVVVYAYYGTFSGSSSLVATEDDVQYDTRPLSGASQILQVQLVDTSGDPITGLDYTDVTCYLSVDGAAPSAQTLVDATVGAYTSLGFKEISSANMPGAYMFCPATLPSSGQRATFRFTATGTRPAVLHVDLTASDPRAAALTTSDIDAAEISVNVAKINDAAVQGDGTSGDLWRGA